MQRICRASSSANLPRNDAAPNTSWTIAELNAELVERLRNNELRAEALPVLLDITRDKLAVNKPGYAS